MNISILMSLVSEDPGLSQAALGAIFTPGTMGVPCVKFLVSLIFLCDCSKNIQTKTSAISLWVSLFLVFPGFQDIYNLA